MLLVATLTAPSAAARSFRRDDGAALVAACTVAADDPLHDVARGFCLRYLAGAMQLYRAAADAFSCT